MTLSRPVLHRTGLGVIAGAAAGGLAAIQGLDGWPSLRTVAVVLTPVPLVLATVRGGVAAAVAGIGVGALAVGAGVAGADVPAWAFLVGYSGMVAYVLYAAGRLQHLNVVAGVGLLLAVGLALLDLTVRAQHGGHSLSDAYGTLMGEIETELMASPAMRDLDADTRGRLMETLPIVQRLFPAFAVLQFASSIAISCGVCLLALRRLKLQDVPPLRFAAWRLPDWFVFTFIGPAAGLLLGLWQGWPGLTTAAANALLLVGGIYLLQGAAILHALLRRLQAHPVLEGVVFVAGFLLFGAMMLMLLAVAGLFDFLVDFRGRWTPASPAPGERPGR